MMIVYYYRSADATLVEAKSKDNAASMVLEARALAFAENFGAMPVFSRGFAPHCAGIAFTPEKPARYPVLWSKPTKEDSRAHLRDARAVPPKLKAERNRLAALWNEKLPKEIMQPRESQLLQALGVTNEMLPGNAMSYFHDKDSVSYIITTLPLTVPSLQEVTASVMQQAKHDWDLWQAQMQHAAQQAVNEPQE